ncbi:MAG TPA: DUF4097 family beta strand repeat-containing protein [Pyrinomonadaceae bacterium]|nr:DUF4097 family beta strand repeat-containing protein [Pyrinomonadaceae bacterium]
MLRKGVLITIILAAVMCSTQILDLRVNSAQIDNLRFAQLDAWRILETGVADDAGAVDEVREEFRKSFPLSPTGRVSLENLNGNVRIDAWDRDEVQVNAVKRANTKERLNELNIDINASAEVVIIKTIYPQVVRGGDYRRRDESFATVDYTLSVPRKSRLESIDLVNGSLEIDRVEGDVKASTVNGRLAAAGLMSEAKLSTVNGSLEAVFTQLDQSREISIGSVNGGVVLIIPSDANAIVRANTVHGEITNDFGLGVEEGKYAGRELYGQLGSGGARVKIGNVNGPIAIRHAQDGRKLSSATCLLPQKDKEKLGKGENYKLDEETRRLVEEAKREALGEIDDEKIRQQIAAEADREIEQAIREAHREIERAQREIEREVQREARHQLREERRSYHRGESSGAGKGRGEGTSGLVDRESKTFTVTGKPNLNIGTYGGVITLRGWDKSEVMYTATKRGGDADELAQIQIQSEQDGSNISIIVTSELANGSADLEVYVPRNASVHASTDDGGMSVAGISGDLTLRSGDGSIEAADGTGQLEANTGDGGIDIRNFKGQVRARTGDGAISLDGNFSALTADTGSGAITLSVPADSHFTVESNAEDLSSEGLEVTEDHAPSKRMRRWKVGGGGSLFILRTGDGKLLLRSR